MPFRYSLRDLGRFGYRWRQPDGPGPATTPTRTLPPVEPYQWREPDGLGPPTTPTQTLPPVQAPGVQWKGRDVSPSTILQGMQTFLPPSAQGQPIGDIVRNTPAPPAGTPQVQWQGRNVPWENVLKGAQMYLPPSMQNMTIEQLQAMLARGGQR